MSGSSVRISRGLETEAVQVIAEEIRLMRAEGERFYGVAFASSGRFPIKVSYCYGGGVFSGRPQEYGRALWPDMQVAMELIARLGLNEGIEDFVRLSEGIAFGSTQYAISTKGMSDDRLGLILGRADEIMAVVDTPLSSDLLGSFLKVTSVEIIEAFPDPALRVAAFCTIIFNHRLVVHDIRLIRGLKGPFVAMPSRKHVDHCPQCNARNDLSDKFCRRCGLARDDAGRELPEGKRMHCDTVHPIDNRLRDEIEADVIGAYREATGHDPEALGPA